MDAINHSPDMSANNCTIYPCAQCIAEREASPAGAYGRPHWVDGRVTNKGGLPLWSGKGEPPAIGSEVTCNDPHGTRVTVTGYRIAGGWLMVRGYRTAEPDKAGNLAGAEILYPEFEVRPVTDAEVTAWLRDNWVRPPAGKRAAVMRRDSKGRLQVWSWHVSETAAHRAIRDAAARRPVR